MCLRIIDIVLKKTPVLTNREQPLLQLSFFVEVIPESNIADLNLMRKDLSAELPFDWLLLEVITWKMCFFEKTHCSISIANGEVISRVLRNRKLGDREALSIGCLQRSVQLLELSGLSVHDFDFTIVLSYENL